MRDVFAYITFAFMHLAVSFIPSNLQKRN